MTEKISQKKTERGFCLVKKTNISPLQKRGEKGRMLLKKKGGRITKKQASN